MTTEGDLKDVIKKKLESTGDWKKLKCKMRLLTFEMLKQQQQEQHSPNEREANQVEISNETKKLNELIFEYLRWNGYHYTAEMLLTETNYSIHNKDLLDSLIEDKQNLELPELYYLLEKKNFYED